MLHSCVNFISRHSLDTGSFLYFVANVVVFTLGRTKAHFIYTHLHADLQKHNKTFKNLSIENKCVFRLQQKRHNDSHWICIRAGDCVQCRGACVIWQVAQYLRHCFLCRKIWLSLMQLAIKFVCLERAYKLRYSTVLLTSTSLQEAIELAKTSNHAAFKASAGWCVLRELANLGKANSDRQIINQI